MKVALVVIGKTDARYFVEAIEEYTNRLVHYIPFEMQVIPDIKNVKNLSEEQQKEKEGELILKGLQPGDYLVLLDDKERVHFERVCQVYGKEDAECAPTAGVCRGWTLRIQ